MKVVRILLYVLAVAAGLQIIGGLLIYEVSPELLGVLVWLAAPGAVALVLALRLPKGRRPLLVGIIALQVFLLLLALGRIGNGDVQGLSNLILPVLILGFVLTKPSRAFLAS